VHEQRLVRPEPGDIRDQQERAGQQQRRGRRNLGRNHIRHRNRRSGLGHRDLGEAAAAGERGDPLAGLQARHARTELPDPAGYLQAGEERPGRHVARVTAASHHVEEVHPGM
jgi:hypothetical protein